MIVVEKIEGGWKKFTGTPRAVDSTMLDPVKVQSLINEGLWTTEDLPPSLSLAEPFIVPEGKQKTGAPSYVDSGGSIKEVFDVEDTYLPTRWLVPKSTVLSRLTDAQLSHALSLMTVRQQERWRAPDKPEVWNDDPDTIAVLQAVGANPTLVLANTTAL